MVEAIAIDGPAGAGKSTVARLLAERLGFQYLDTGAMYRCVALAAVRSGLPLNDPTALGRLAEEIRIEFQPGTPQRVFLNGEDVTDLIRTAEVSEAASVVSVHPEVRKQMVRRQRQLCEAGGVVLEGRDTTTVVCPDARLKVFLTASLEERARRRLRDLRAAGAEATFEEVLEQIRERDARDSGRSVSPLQRAEGALVVDSEGISPEEVRDRILAAWVENGGQPPPG